MNTVKPINYLREAFVHPLNLGVLLVASLSAFFLAEWGLASNVILSFVFGIELMYLGVAPNLPSFRKKIRRRKAQSRSAKTEEKSIFEHLDQNSRRRFLVLKHLTKLIQENFDRLPYSSQGLLDNIRKKVNDLLTNYMQMLELNFRYKEYINKTQEDEIKQEIQKEEGNIEETTSQKLIQSRKRRLDILKKRLKKLELAKENNMVCESHLETIEDAIRYIYEQSMTMSDPEQIGFQLDNLLSEVEETSEIVDELDDELLPMHKDLEELEFDHDLNIKSDLKETELEPDEDSPESDQNKTQSDNRIKQT